MFRPSLWLVKLELFTFGQSNEVQTFAFSRKIIIPYSLPYTHDICLTKILIRIHIHQISIIICHILKMDMDSEIIRTIYIPNLLRFSCEKLHLKKIPILFYKDTLVT